MRVDAIVHEAHDGPGDGLGAFLTLAPNGPAALRALDMFDAVRRAVAFPPPPRSSSSTDPVDAWA
ncbi:hypothetical protein [Nocardiopsis sp. MG754419]|uniref:hypothetical protein n=1 Tax=Nocardiopsis sp. MG754419 TaxID=2259865 RepID=UPI0027DEA3AA|nr:hypothetical protein [Nocardiopsis sp. MG754419]